jgi:hypothetical protein
MPSTVHEHLCHYEPSSVHGHSSYLLLLRTLPEVLPVLLLLHPTLLLR